MLKNLLNVCKILILKSPKNFLIMVALLIIQALVIYASVISIIPLADFIIDSELSKPSIFTKKFIIFFSYFNVEANFFVCAAFFAITQFLVAILTSLIRYIILAIKYDFIKKLNDETLQSLLSSEWLFFATSDYGYLTNTFLKETEKIEGTTDEIVEKMYTILKEDLQIL